MLNFLDLLGRERECEKHIRRYERCINNKKNKFEDCYVMHMNKFHSCVKKMNLK